MKIGAMNHPARNPLEEIDWFGRQGFDFVDFTLEPPAADPNQIDPDAVRAALDRHGLSVVAHTAWFIPIGSPFGSIREASLVEFRRALRAARGDDRGREQTQREDTLHEQLLLTCAAAGTPRFERRRF